MKVLYIFKGSQHISFKTQFSRDGHCGFLECISVQKLSEGHKKILL